MKVRYRMFTDPEKPLAGKIILVPETPEELSAMTSFLKHVGSKQAGNTRLEVYYKWRRDEKASEDASQG